MNDLIDRQQAIEAYGDWYVEEGPEEGFIGTVKQLLEGLPSAEPELVTNLQQTCNQVATDCISRQDAIDAFYIQADDDGWWIGTVQDMEEFLKGLPSAEPSSKRGWYQKGYRDGLVRMKGKWVNEGVYGEGHSMCSIRCSNCDWHYIGYLGDYNYCPNCGAEMMGDIDG